MKNFLIYPLARRSTTRLLLFRTTVFSLFFLSATVTFAVMPTIPEEPGPAPTAASTGNGRLIYSTLELPDRGRSASFLYRDRLVGRLYGNLTLSRTVTITMQIIYPHLHAYTQPSSEWKFQRNYWPDTYIWNENHIISVYVYSNQELAIAFNNAKHLDSSAYVQWIHAQITTATYGLNKKTDKNNFKKVISYNATVLDYIPIPEPWQKRR